MSIQKLEGWKIKKVGKITLLQCPYCNHSAEGFMGSGENKVKCFGCNKEFPSNFLKEKEVRTSIGVCNTCGSEIPFTSDYFSGLGYSCIKCGNLVGVKFRNQVLQPKTTLDLGWNSEIKTRSVQVNERLQFVMCKTAKDNLVIELMCKMAKSENSEFRMFHRPQKSGILFNDNKYFGYVIWTESKYAGLRQIYIIEEERSKGLGAFLLKFWVENIANRINEKFGIEKPNEKICKILIKLGYAKEIEQNGEKKLLGIKCLFIPSV